MKNFQLICLALFLFTATAIPFNCGGGLFSAIAGGDSTGAALIENLNWIGRTTPAFSMVSNTIGFIDSAWENSNNNQCTENFKNYLNQWFPTHSQVANLISNAIRATVVIDIENDHRAHIANMLSHRHLRTHGSVADFVRTDLRPFLQFCSKSTNKYLDQAGQDHTSYVDKMILLTRGSELMKQGLDLAEEIYHNMARYCNDKGGRCTSSDFISTANILNDFAVELHLTDEKYWRIEEKLYNYRAQPHLMEYCRHFSSGTKTTSKNCNNEKKGGRKVTTCVDDREEAPCCYRDTGYIGGGQCDLCASFDGADPFPACVTGQCKQDTFSDNMRNLCKNTEQGYARSNHARSFAEVQYANLRRQNRDVWWKERGNRKIGRHPETPRSWSGFHTDESFIYRWLHAEVSTSILACNLLKRANIRCGHWIENIANGVADPWETGAESWSRRHHWTDSYQGATSNNPDINPFNPGRRRELLEDCDFEGRKEELAKLLREKGPGALPECRHENRDNKVPKRPQERRCEEGYDFNGETCVKTEDSLERMYLEMEMEVEESVGASEVLENNSSSVSLGAYFLGFFALGCVGNMVIGRMFTKKGDIYETLQEI